MCLRFRSSSFFFPSFFLDFELLIEKNAAKIKPKLRNTEEETEKKQGQTAE